MFRKYFTLSFDDGLEQDKRLIQLLKKYELQCTFNVNAGLLGQRQRIGRIGNFGLKSFPESDKRNRWLKNHANNRIPQDEIRQVYQGFEVAAHGYSHKNLRRLDESSLRFEIEEDLADLSRLVGYPVLGYAYPFGAASAKVEGALKTAGMVYAREIMPRGGFSFPDNPLRFKPNCSHISNNVLALAETFIKAERLEEDLLFCVWGHGYELDFGTAKASWKRIETLFDTIAGKDDILYCTNKEAFLAHERTTPDNDY